MFLFKDFITVELCRKHKDFIYVFGDNLAGWGTGGQAVIRREKNSIGVVTKREPTRSPAAYFSDSSSEMTSVLADLNNLDKLSAAGKVIILPTNVVGSGLAKLEQYSPKIYKLLQDWWDSKAKLYTGNFPSLKKTSITPISICRVLPKWAGDMVEYKSLAPNINVLMKYKKKTMSEEEYIIEFDKVLRETLPLTVITELLSDNKSKVLVCYCARKDFCHRHLVAEWLSINLDITIEEVNTGIHDRKLGYLCETNEIKYQ